MTPLVSTVDRFVTALGAWGYLALGTASAVEYVVPPFPGDTLTLLGGVYVARGQRSAGLMLLALTLGSVAGAAINFALGRALASRIDARPDDARILGISVGALRRLGERMRTHGRWVIAINRFMPGVRALVFVAAGAARMPFVPVLALGAVSATVFNALMLWAGIALGGNLEALTHALVQYQRAVWGLVAVAGLALMLRFLTKARTS